MRRRIDNILITIAVVSMLAFIVAGGFMTVYFHSGMVREYGQEFTDVVQYFLPSAGYLQLPSALHSMKEGLTTFFLTIML